MVNKYIPICSVRLHLSHWSSLDLSPGPKTGNVHKFCISETLMTVRHLDKGEQYDTIILVKIVN